MSDYKLSPEDIRSKMARHAGAFPDELCRKHLEQADCLQQVCVLPANLNERLSYLANVLVQSVGRPGDDQLTLVVGRLCKSLSYMMNSASWRAGELYDFDMDEVQRKLVPLTSQQPGPAHRTGHRPNQEP